VVLLRDAPDNAAYESDVLIIIILMMMMMMMMMMLIFDNAAYESGVFNGCNQTGLELNHAVQLVGYGHDSDLKVRALVMTCVGFAGFLTAALYHYAKL
jgi:hypothetical protein